MAVHAIGELIQGKVPYDTTVNIQGWVRTRRDSKAGISFLQIHDGSCFASIQIVVANTLDNYQQEILRLTAGCSVSVSGKLVASQGKGQAVEIQAEQITVVGWVDNPDSYPIQAKRHKILYHGQKC